MSKLYVSAIIVAYWSEEYINECITSLHQSARYAHVPLEVIIVINDKDNRKYKLPLCKIIKNPSNFGFAKAANIGARFTVGNWLLLLNPDTITRLSAIKYLVKHCNNNNIAVIAPKILNGDGSLQHNIDIEPTLWNIFLEQSYLYKILPQIFRLPLTDNSLYLKAHFVDAISGSFMLVRKEVFERIGGLDERFFMYQEDLDLCKKIRIKNYKIIFQPHAEIIHFNHQSNSGFKVGSFYFDSYYAYFRKYRSQIYTFVCISLILMGSLVRLLYWKMYYFLNNKSPKSVPYKYKGKIKFYQNVLRRSVIFILRKKK